MLEHNKMMIKQKQVMMMARQNQTRTSRARRCCTSNSSSAAFTTPFACQCRSQAQGFAVQVQGSALQMSGRNTSRSQIPRHCALRILSSTATGFRSPRASSVSPHPASSTPPLTHRDYGELLRSQLLQHSVQLATHAISIPPIASAHVSLTSCAMCVPSSIAQHACRGGQRRRDLSLQSGCCQLRFPLAVSSRFTRCVSAWDRPMWA